MPRVLLSRPRALGWDDSTSRHEAAAFNIGPETIGLIIAAMTDIHDGCQRGGRHSCCNQPRARLAVAKRGARDRRPIASMILATSDDSQGPAAEANGAAPGALARATYSPRSGPKRVSPRRSSSLSGWTAKNLMTLGNGSLGANFKAGQPAMGSATKEDFLDVTFCNFIFLNVPFCNF